MAKGSVGNYLKNVTSSIKYAAIDKFKELAPAPADFVENNATMFREVRDSVTKMRSSNMKQISNQIDKRSKIFDTADTVIKNVFSDLRSGKFYNKEREMSGDMFGDDMGLDSQDSWVNSDWNLDDDSQYLGGMMDQVGAKTTSAICNTMAQTSTAINENIKASTKLSYTQNVQTYNLLRKGLSNISDNMIQMVEFSNTVMRTHVENSKTFYETSTSLQEKQVELLEKIYESVREDKKPEYKRSRGLTYSSITSGGIVDIKEYAKLVKKNMSNTVSGSPIGMLQGIDPSMLAGMATQSPLQILPKAMVDKMISKNAEKIFEDFNNTFSGLFGSVIMKVNEYSENGNNAFLRGIANALGIKTGLKTSLSTSNYEKGTIRWNGKANKALTEVIPTYLAKIEAALTGKTARIFDYESGVYVNADKIRDDLNDKLESRAKSAGYEMTSRFKSESNYIQFETTKEQEQFSKDVDNFIIALFKRGKSFNFTKANIDNEFSQYGVSSKRNFQIIKNMFMNSPRGMQMVLNDRILKERDSYNQMMMDLETQGNDLSLMLYNNSGLMGEDEEISRARADIVKLENYQKSLKYKSTEKYKKVADEIDKLKEKVKNSSSYKEDTKPTNNNFLVKYVDKKGHNVFWYLENILVAIKNSDGFGDSGGYFVPDDSMTTAIDQYKEKKMDAADVSLRQRNKDARNSKDGMKYISADNAADNSKLKSNMRIRKEAELKAEKDRNKWEGRLFLEGEIDPKEFKQKMSEATFFGKIKLLSSALTNIVQRPMDAMAKIADGIDKKMYNIIYGGPIVMEDGKKVEGLLGVMSYHIKDTFSNIKEWFNDSFGALFNTRLANIKGKINFKKFFDETAIGKMAQEFGQTIVSAFKTAKLGVTSVVNPLTEKIVGKKVGSLDEMIINGMPLRSYFDSNMSDKEILETIKSDSRFENLSSADKKMIDRYSGNLNRYNTAIMKTFGNLTSKMRLSAKDNETLQKLLEPMFYNLSIDTLGKNEKEVISNLKSGKFGTLEDLFGKLVQDQSGNWVHDKNDQNRLITDDALYNSFMEAMDKTGFSKARGHESYNIGEFFEQDFSTGLNNIEDAINQIYEDANEYNKKVTDQNGTIINQQSNIVTNVERIVYLLSKMANEEVPGYIKAKMYREKVHNEEVGKANHEFISKFRGSDSPYLSSYEPRTKSGSLFGEAWDNLDLTQLGKGSIKGHANGARYITKSGITAISKGEMVIPSDKNPFNPNRNKVNRSQEIINERRIIREFSKGKTPYMNATGTVDDLTQNDIDLIAKQFNIPEFDSKYTDISRLDNGATESRSYTATDTENGRRVLFIINAEDKANIQNYRTEGVEHAAEMLGNSLNTAVESITGVSNDKKKNTKLQEAIEDMIKKAGKYGPRMLAGGLVGSFASGALTANIIHPMVGAAIGAGTALLSSSDKFKEWMFGVNEDGEFKDGIIPSNIVNWFAKNGKNIGLTGIGGAVIGGIKGHPLIGLALGAGVGLLNSSKKFKDFMFGEEGLINPERQQKISKLIKSTLIGTIGANVLAPKLMTSLGSFGILPQLLLGTVGGMLATSTKFQEMIFGRKDDATGKYEHGLIPTIRHIVVDPLQRVMHGFGERVQAFVKVNITRPLQTFFEPFSRLRKKSNELIKGFFTNISDHVGRGLSRGFEKSLKPIFDAIGQSTIVKGIKKTLGIGLKAIGTVVNPFKWMELTGKAAGNIMGKMGLMNHLTTEEYNSRYGFFGKNALKRKGQNTIDAIENPENRLSASQYKEMLGNLKLINSSKHNAIKNQKEAASNLKTKLLDNFGSSYVKYDDAVDFANSYDLSNDENGNLNETAQRKLDDLTLEAYRQRMVGQNKKNAFLDSESSAKLLISILANDNNKAKANIGMSIIKKSKNAEDALELLREKGIKVSKGKIKKFTEEFNRYKRFNGIASGKTEEEWNSLGREKRLELMRDDDNFDNEAVASGILNSTKSYRNATLAANNSEALLESVNIELRKSGINPDGLNSRQLEEVLRGQYKNLVLKGLFDDEETEENPIQETSDTVSEIHEVVNERTTEMIDLLREIAGYLDPNTNSKYTEEIKERSENLRGSIASGMTPKEARQQSYNDLGEASSVHADRSAYKISEHFGKTVSEVAEDPSAKLESIGQIFHESDDDKQTEIDEKPSIVQRVKNWANRPFVWHFANGTGPLQKDTLAAVSAGELILDGSQVGYDNGLSNNAIWNLANGTKSNPVDLTSNDTEEVKTEDPKKMSLFQKMSFNMEKMRQSFVSDKELKDSKGGKGPSFLQKMGNGLKSIFDPKKLFKKAGMLAIGAGILLAPLADKILGAVVPFLTEKVIPAITEALPGVIDSLMDLIPSIMEMITTTLPKFIKSIATDLLPALLELLPGLIAGTGDAIAGLVGALPKIIKPILDMLPATFKTLFTEIVPTLWDMLPEFIEVLMGSLGDITQSLLEGTVSVLGSLIQNLPAILVNTLKGIGDVGVSLITGLFGGSGRPKKIPKIQTAINEKMEIPTSYIQNMAAAGKGKQKKNIFSMAGSGITSFFKNLFKKKKTTTESTSEETENSVEKGPNGTTYLNGKQVNPLLAHISQNAQKYKNVSFNLPNIDKGITLGTDGCGVMSGAMVINGLLGEDAVTPEKVADEALRSGNKAAGGGVKTKFFKEYFKRFGIDTTYHNMTNETDKNNSKRNIIKALAKNHPVILMGNDTSNSGKTPFPDNNHYVVATGISEDGSKIMLNDPYNTVGGDIYNLDDVLDKTIVGIEATKDKSGLEFFSSIKYVTKTENSNTYSAAKSASVSSVKPIATNVATTNLGKTFDPIAYQDLGNYNPMTVEEMDNFINYWANANGHTEFVGHGDVFIKAAEETGLDPRYILAHAAVESGWGTSRIAKEKGNYFGITAYNDSPYSSATTFNSGMQGIIDGAKWIRKNYYDAGQRSLYDMIYGNSSHRYAVYDDGSPNSGWISTIASIMRKGPNAYTNTTEVSGSGGINDAEFLLSSVYTAKNITKNGDYTDIQDSEGITNDSAISTLGSAYTSLYNEPYYSSILRSQSPLYSELSTNSSDKKYDLLKYFHGQEYSHSDDSVSFYDNFDTYYNAYKDIAKKIHSRYLANSSNSSNVTEADYETSADNRYDDTTINHEMSEIITKLMTKESPSLFPIVWKDLSLDDAVIDDGNGNKIKFADSKYAQYAGADLLLKEALYNPVILHDSDKLHNLMTDISEKFGTDDIEKVNLLNNLNSLAMAIRKGVELTPAQTEMLYKSPTIYKTSNKLLFGSYGSKNTLPSGVSPMRLFSNIIKPDSSALSALDKQDSEIYEMIKNGDRFSSMTSDYLNKMTMGSATDTMTDATKKVSELEQQAAADVQEQISSIADSLNPSDESESTNGEEEEGFSLLNFLRNIGSFFSEVFDRIGDMIWGNGSWNTGVSTQNYGNPSQISNDEKYSYELTDSVAAKLIVKKRPDNYATNAVKSKSEVIKSFINLSTPNYNISKGQWAITVYAKVPNTNNYFLADGYAITVPSSDIIEVIGTVQDATLIGSSETSSETNLGEATTLQVKKKPDNYGDWLNSEVLKQYANRILPDNLSSGAWNLKVYGKNDNGEYILADGTTVSIPDSDIVNKNDVANISTFGFTQAGQNINELIGNANSAADNFFINSFKSSGSTNSYVSSTGPAYDTISNEGKNTGVHYRVHSGIDYATGKTNPAIYSPISGTVERVRFDDGTHTGAGNYVAIKDDGSVDGTPRYHRFMHMLNNPDFKVGDKVNQGDLIGYVGSTGSSSGEHLHYDISDATGLAGTSNLSASQVNEHFKNPNTYLKSYFTNQGYKGTAIYNQNNNTSSSNSSSTAKGGDYTDLSDIYELILKVVEYLARISDNTGLIGEIVTLLTQLDEINSNTSLTSTQKMEKTVKVRESLANKAKEYSRVLNSANNETTGHQAMVKSMQIIAAN